LIAEAGVLDVIKEADSGRPKTHTPPAKLAILIFANCLAENQKLCYL